MDNNEFDELLNVARLIVLSGIAFAAGATFLIVLAKYLTWLIEVLL